MNEHDHFSSPDSAEITSDDRHYEDDNLTDMEADDDNNDNDGNESDSSEQSLIEFLNRNAARINDSSTTDATVGKPTPTTLQQNSNHKNNAVKLDNTRRNKHKSGETVYRDQYL
jgi:hypothetical protein